MGGQISVPQLIAQLPKPVPPPPPPPPDPRVILEQRRVELNMARNDLIGKQHAYDVVAPDEASQRKINDAKAVTAVYVADIQKQFNYETRLFNQNLNQAISLSNSPTYKLAQKYTKVLEQKRIEVEHDNIKNREQAFTNRRRFLDADPQSGVPGMGGFQTVDEQIMLAFWLTYLLFAAILILYVIETNISTFGNPPNMRDALMTGVISYIIAIFVAHRAIRYFAT
jgi:hypothetical protein